MATENESETGETKIGWMWEIPDKRLQDRISNLLWQERFRKGYDIAQGVAMNARLAGVVVGDGPCHAAMYDKETARGMFGGNGKARLYHVRVLMVPNASPLYSGDLI